MRGDSTASARRVSGPRPVLWLAWIGASATIGYVIGAPLSSAEYPMMTDFPFHTASSSILRHYGDADWHFREQFALQPLTVPYLTLYGLSALLMVVLPPVVATKIAAAFLLALLPAGLMVLCAGMRKSPFLGLWGLVPAWGVLAHWGFVSFLGALGLFAMCLGLALRVVDQPSVRGQAWLLACLVLLFFTHVSRVPVALGALMLVGVLMHGRVESVRGLLVPGVVALVLFMWWWTWRPWDGAFHIAWAWPPDWSRFKDVPTYFADVFVDESDAATFRRIGLAFALTAIVLFVVAATRLRGWPNNHWLLAAHLVVASVILTSLVLYLTLPMEIAGWWYVFPREITAALFLLPALLPNLPRNVWAQLGFVVWTALVLVPLGESTAGAHRDFGTATVHFREIVRELPHAPKLLYLVYDHHGSRAQASPYVHLPAYVQAERGGWLSFHFAGFGGSPIRYRSSEESGATVPPETPLRWEWTPELFNLEEHAGFFDWFLVRRLSAPDDLFAGDPSIRRVARFENWWLYHRVGAATGPHEESP